ncbi:MAG: matrixin family metalloprotease [Proteobacteria bacterium]|nr:matrixin family metalloprotease [Pseudomonadota bacterium]
MVLIFFIASFMLSSKLQAFVLLSGPLEARLEATEESPKITFMLSMNPPAIANKERFMDGAYADLSDEDFWLMLVKLAMTHWNDVADAYIEMDVEFSSEARIDPEDMTHSIVVGKTNLTSSAYAQPKITGHKIVDCDINVSERRSDAGQLAFTLLHELGHCLGLGHNHSDYSAVMGYSRTDHSLNLGLDDQAGLVFLYPLASLSQAHERVSCGTLSGPTKPYLASYLGFLLPLLFLGVPGLCHCAKKLRHALHL